MFPAPFVSDVPRQAPVATVVSQERPASRAFVGSQYVTAVVAGQVVAVPRHSVLVGANGELTLPVQDE